MSKGYFKAGLAFIYFIGFLILVNQWRGLMGSSGITPAALFVEEVGFFQSPSLFFLNSSDGFMILMAWVGLALSIFAISGYSEKFGNGVSTVVWFLLWLIYLSFVNVGQIFYGFGWEILLLEAGFLSIFLGARNTPTPKIVIWLLRWLLFRLMLGAGLIKWRGDECWRDLTCMYFYYETQPLPNPLSWFFHHLPGWIHQSAVLFTHFVELIVPFGFLLPHRFRHVRYICALITIFFQGMLIISGNLSWLNYITIVLCIVCFDEGTDFKKQKPNRILNYAARALTALVILLSIQPTINLFSSRQLMNSSFDPLHLVNTYGAFGSITRNRMEIVIEGAADSKITPQTRWLEYEFKGKPGDVSRLPPLVSPYHYKLDWQMWFAAMSSYQNHPWFLSLVAKMLQNNPEVLALLGKNPFPGEPPRFIRARVYKYYFTDFGASNWWKRELQGEYLQPVTLK